MADDDATAVWLISSMGATSCGASELLSAGAVSSAAERAGEIDETARSAPYRSQETAPYLGGKREDRELCIANRTTQAGDS